MAKKLSEREQVDFDAPKKAEAKYPWDEWFDGGQWLLTQAEDFPDVASVGSMQRTVAATARRRGIEIRTTKLSPDTLVICASQEGA